jgi:ATP-dependent RNA helicase RhlE
MQEHPFKELGITKQFTNVLDELGYEAPTPIQEKAIPIILNGQHVIGVAPTGTGKTAAFALPILNKLKCNNPDFPRCLILLPTRELAHQVFEEFIQFAKNTDIKAVKLIGGSGIKLQREALEEGPDVIIATPGRFMDLYREGRIFLRKIETLILDEADKMMDMGFLPQLNQVLEVMPRKRQNLLFSATFHENVEKLSEEFLEFPVKVEVGIHFQAAETIDQYIYKVPNYATKCTLMLHLLEKHNMQKVLVFVRTKETANYLFKFLDRKHQNKWQVIHANKGTNTRLNAYEAFKNGEIDGLVATDLAARGIDIKDVSHVINFDFPVLYSDYIHRVGRTGRAEKEGTAISLISPVEEFHLKKLEAMINHKIQELSIPEDIEIVKTNDEELKAQKREIDRLRKKEDPEYQGAFHERKSNFKGKKKVSKRVVKAYKFSGKRKGKN